MGDERNPLISRRAQVNAVRSVPHRDPRATRAFNEFDGRAPQTTTGRRCRNPTGGVGLESANFGCWLAGWLAGAAAAGVL